MRCAESLGNESRYAATAAKIRNMTSSKLYGRKAHITARVFAICVQLGLFACSDDCQHFSGRHADSPDGEWSARSTRNVCGGKALALGSDTTTVELYRNPSNILTSPVQVFSGDNLTDSDVSLRWLSNQSLELTVPAHTHVELQMAKVDGIDLSVQIAPSGQ
jgi:hypothetical protein